VNRSRRVGAGAAVEALGRATSVKDGEGAAGLGTGVALSGVELQDASSAIAKIHGRRHARMSQQ
jgi:hypothetical protein